jgi:outer membrane lipase/esterase
MNSNRIVRWLSALSFSLVAVLLASCGDNGANKFQYSGFVVIGASLSDTGNVFAATSGTSPGAAPNYFGGRWSNGPLWIENVAANYGKSAQASLLGGSNYAYGGAKTCAIPNVTSSVPDMCDQATQYLAAVVNKADATTLYVIDATSVGNEINTVISSGGALPSSLITTTAPANVIAIIQRLYDAGARRFLVANSTNVGATPLYLSGAFAGAGPTATTLATGFNATLGASLDKFVTQNPAANIARLDTFALFNTIVANPSAYGIDNTTSACTQGPAPAAICATPDTYTFWDTFHPTKIIGKIFSNTTLSII